MPNGGANVVNMLFVYFEVVYMFGFVFARIAVMPNDVNVVNTLFVFFEVAFMQKIRFKKCPLCN